MSGVDRLSGAPHPGQDPAERPISTGASSPIRKSGTSAGRAMARQIAADEVVQIPVFGTMVMPGPKGFQHGSTYRLNPSYVPLQVILGLGRFMPNGPWRTVAANIPALIKDSAAHGFVSDWVNLKAGERVQVSSAIGSYDAIRVYLWAGMLDKATHHRDELLKSISGMATYLRTNSVPPAKGTSRWKHRRSVRSIWILRRIATLPVRSSRRSAPKSTSVARAVRIQLADRIDRNPTDVLRPEPGALWPWL